VGIEIGVGAVTIVAAGCVAALVPPSQAGVRLAVVAVALGAFAAVARDGRAVGGTAMLSWLVVDGFLVDRSGELSWHGATDLRRIGLLAAGAGLGAGYRGLRRARSRWRASATSQPGWRRPIRRRGRGMSQRGSRAMPDLAFVLLTVVLFGLLALVARAVEKL
jgi:hypothetical protein